MVLAKHVRVGSVECHSRLLNNAGELEVLLVRAVRAADATILYSAGHQFTPQGATCFALSMLAESHAWIHTWPENKAYLVDVLTCGERVDPLVATWIILNTLGGNYEDPVIEYRG